MNNDQAAVGYSVGMQRLGPGRPAGDAVGNGVRSTAPVMTRVEQISAQLGELKALDQKMEVVLTQVLRSPHPTDTCDQGGITPDTQLDAFLAMIESNLQERISHRRDLLNRTILPLPV